MSGSTTVASSGGGGGGGMSGYRPPFTPVQWQELEHQALIYKYLVAGVPVPYDLVVPIRRSLEAL
nr:growth-regulating factor 4-like isoform X1 [Tanacetum cinerariifolium]